MIAVIDNYDSFTYNLVQYLGELGAEPRVFRNDHVTIQELEALAPSHIVISPGPGTPADDAGISNAAIRAFHGRTPILGVCLGHQCIAHVFGGHVGRAPQLMHGKVSRITHQGGPLFAGIPASFQATRYHSLIVEEPLPAELEATARAGDGEIMALRHRQAPTFGVQFHPESILTPHGKRLLQNFLHTGVGHACSVTSDAGACHATSVTYTGALAGAAEPAITLPAAIERALQQDHLSMAEAEVVMMHIMDGEATPAQIGGYLTALRAKGETVAEITGFARAMRRHVTPVQATRRPLIDTCGTGGDRAGSFNISTTAALVVAGAGVAVAKHGNRSVSSQCGSADVLSALGVRLDLAPEALGRCIDEVGFGFLFAPALHPAMRHAIGPRRELGVRTVFNILGPLTNPAGASCQVVGVYDRGLVDLIAQVLRDLGSEAAYVVHSADGLDELSTAGINHVACLRDGQVTTLELDGRTLGLTPATRPALLGGDAAGNAAITQEILAGAHGPRRDVVLLNAGVALAAAGAVDGVRAGIALAADSIDSGHARRALDNLIAFSREAA